MTMYNFVGKKNRLYETELDQMKENSNCPDSEKSGSGPGSCGGSKGREQDPASKKVGGGGLVKSKTGSAYADMNKKEPTISLKIEKAATQDASKLVNEAYAADISIEELSDPDKIREQADQAYDDAIEGELITKDTKEVKAAFQKAWMKGYKKALSSLEE